MVLLLDSSNSTLGCWILSEFFTGSPDGQKTGRGNERFGYFQLGMSRKETILERSCVAIIKFYCLTSVSWLIPLLWKELIPRDGQCICSQHLIRSELIACHVWWCADIRLHVTNTSLTANRCGRLSPDLKLSAVLSRKKTEKKHLESEISLSAHSLQPVRHCDRSKIILNFL